MGSIYKKGRDGYYYYQAYIYNPSTKNKDKRIFHSLGTKDKNEAHKMKLELDIKYENFKNNWFDIFNIKRFLKYSYYILFVILLSIYLYKSFFRESQIGNHKVLIIDDKNDDFNFKSDSINNDLLKFKSDPNINSNDLSEKNIMQDHFFDSQSNNISYEIVRVEQMGGNFNQGKFFILVDLKIKEEQILFVIKEVKAVYDNFSNIIILFYSNDSLGRDFANGNIKNYNTIEYQKAWLALYSFNDVEGEYFDFNPSQYRLTY